MARTLLQKFPASRVTAATAEYPGGSYKDETVPDVSDDGTPLSLEDDDDLLGFSDALLAEAGITESGVNDTALASDRLDAIKVLIANIEDGRLLDVQIFTASGTWNKPAGTQSVEVWAIGGGGGGGGADTDGSGSDVGVGGGGGGGGCAYKHITSGLGITEIITVGAAGAAGSGTGGTSGGSGGNSSFGSHITGNGGAGSGGSGTNGLNNDETLGGVGGSGTAAGGLVTQGGHGLSGVGSFGGSGGFTQHGGPGGDSGRGFGHGGRAELGSASSHGAVPSDGTGNGGGGGGAVSTSSGGSDAGAGTVGLVMVRSYS